MPQQKPLIGERPNITPTAIPATIRHITIKASRKVVMIKRLLTDIQNSFKTIGS
jgi:hypothetical protein